MVYSNQGFSSHSPVLALQPQHPSHAGFHMDTNHSAFNPPFTNTLSHPSANSWSNLSPVALHSAAGRKRSRDEASLNDEEIFLPQPNDITPAESEDEWEYGEGMTLVRKSRKGYQIDASSQTGTWAEEKAEQEKQELLRLAALARPPSPAKPVLRSHKSQRLNLTTSPSMGEETSLGNNALSTPSSSVATGITGSAEPMVDDFTRHLGIGWSSISSDEHIQAAARGWTKFIENHYPVTNAKIRLQSRGLASYLVEADQGYFLFGEDLKQGRLVSQNIERVWANLQGPTPMFDGEGIMHASTTPKVGDVAAQVPLNGNDIHQLMMNGTVPAMASQQSLEVDMDMS
ncbi:hypothetical protein F5884DRAFT_33936 [Xylogone sp. PMI_703]|nr:hypothetical protein F5884DRAFT_33936 [Xylogone sp. PMI_703]